jgi:hypothetical protein
VEAARRAAAMRRMAKLQERLRIEPAEFAFAAEMEQDLWYKQQRLHNT